MIVSMCDKGCYVIVSKKLHISVSTWFYTSPVWKAFFSPKTPREWEVHIQQKISVNVTPKESCWWVFSKGSIGCYHPNSWLTDGETQLNLSEMMCKKTKGILAWNTEQNWPASWLSKWCWTEAVTKTLNKRNIVSRSGKIETQQVLWISVLASAFWFI